MPILSLLKLVQLISFKMNLKSQYEYIWNYALKSIKNGVADATLFEPTMTSKTS